VLLGALPAWGDPITVTDREGLQRALATAAPGQELLLAPGDYGPLILHGVSGEVDAPLTLRSADPARPARFNHLELTDTRHLRVSDVVLDYTYQPTDLETVQPFTVTGGADIALKGVVIDGDLAPTAVGPFPTAFGLTVTGVAGFTLQASEIRAFLRGLLVTHASDVVVEGNDLHSLRSDGMAFAAIDGARIARNHIHDFLRSEALGDHADMIQFWTAGTDSPSAGIVIRDNILNSGSGLYTQSIFLRNERVDRGEAGADMFYRDLLIEGNAIINAHLHGITVGESDGLVIRNNSVIRNAASSGVRADPNLWTPQIRVADRSRNVVIERNVVQRITAPKGRADWQVGENLLIQDQWPQKPGFYDRVFINARRGDPGDPASFAPLPGGPLDGAGLGAPLLSHPVDWPLRSEASFRPLIRVQPDPTRPRDIRFTTVTDRLPEGIDPTKATYRWQFEDGTELDGPDIRRRFVGAGRQQVTLTLSLPDGRSFINRRTVTIPGPIVTTFRQGEGLSGSEGGTMVALDLPKGKSVDAPLHLGDGLPPVLIPRQAMAAFFGAHDFRLDLRLRRRGDAVSTGEVLRIHNVLILRVRLRGQIEATLATAGAARPVNIVTRPARFHGDDWQTVTLAYSAETGLFRLLLDGVEEAQGKTSGRLPPMEGWGLSLGDPFSKNQAYSAEVSELTLTANTAEGAAP
jgi:hypothetical protein